MLSSSWKATKAHVLMNCWHVDTGLLVWMPSNARVGDSLWTTDMFCCCFIQQFILYLKWSYTIKIPCPFLDRHVSILTGVKKRCWNCFPEESTALTLYSAAQMTNGWGHSHVIQSKIRIRVQAEITWPLLKYCREPGATFFLCFFFSWKDYYIKGDLPHKNYKLGFRLQIQKKIFFAPPGCAREVSFCVMGVW